MSEEAETLEFSPEVEAYALALAAYESAKSVLERCLQKLHNGGVYPSPVASVRFRLPDERQGVTHRGKLGSGDTSLKFYIRPGLYPDGRVGEIFIDAEKTGSFEAGLLDAFATIVSLALQHGVPLERIVKKMMFTRFEPSGFSRHQDVGLATSVVDYLVRWLAFRFEPKIMEGHSRPKAELVE